MNPIDEERQTKFRQAVRAEISAYTLIGTATEEGNDRIKINAYFDPERNEYHFITEDLDQFWRMDPSQILEPDEEIWRNLFEGRGWYAVKLKKGVWSLRFSVR